MPEFWPDKPAIWFAQAEAQFTISSITQDSTKYSYIVAQSDSRHATEVEYVIMDPPPSGKCEHLKEELIRRLSISDEQRV